MLGLDRQQVIGPDHHRAHGVGQHQGAKPAGQRVFEHGHDIRVHEGLAAGEPDLRRAQLFRFDLIQIAGDFGGGNIDEPIVN